jgi:hypothetical protein
MSLRHGIIKQQYRGHALVTPPAIEPVTVNELKAELKHPGGSDEDASLALYISAAREYCEELTGLALITQTWRMTLDRWPSDFDPWWDGVRDGAIGSLSDASRSAQIELPRYPLTTVTSVAFDGNPADIGATFIVDTQQRPGRLVLKFGATLPPYLESANAIQITYTAGYGAASSSVPAALRLAILQMAAYHYTHRGDDCAAADAARESGALNTFSKYQAARL